MGLFFDALHIFFICIFNIIFEWNFLIYLLVITGTPVGLLPYSFRDFTIDDFSIITMSFILFPEANRTVSICVHFPSKSIENIRLKMALKDLAKVRVEGHLNDPTNTTTKLVSLIKLSDYNCIFACLVNLNWGNDTAVIIPFYFDFVIYF